MEVLIWLAAPVAVTTVAMLWVGWSGRTRDTVKSDARAQERLARAMKSRRTRKPLMMAARQEERSSGVAVRPSRRGSDTR